MRSILAVFLAEESRLKKVAAAADQWLPGLVSEGARRKLEEALMERREFLQSTLVSAAATFLGVAPKANAAITLPFSKDNAMPNNIRPYEPLTSENAALVLVDHQVGLMTGVRDYSIAELKHNVVGLAKAATALRLPIVVTTTARDSMWGPTFPELVEALPGVQIIDRSTVNAFDDPGVARAIEATDRRKLIFAGLSLEVCAAFPAITAVGKGFDAYVAVDACGTFNETKRQVGLLRMMQAGVIVSDYATLMIEVLKDNARPEAGAVYGAIEMDWAKLVGQIAKAYAH